jgi:hypothetical protein
MRITPAGQVYVNGTQVHPDYVFDPDYELMPLSALRSFVAENRHLPGVISSEEAEGTIDLSSFPLQLLEKVEELTLYTIQQDERIATQQEIISRQQTINDELRGELMELRRAVESLQN